MATITVSNLNDSGPGSLREAIASAASSAGADTITFLPGMVGNITLSSGVLQIISGNDLSINGDTNGDGNPDITLSGASQFTHFSIAAGAVVSLTSLAFVDGEIATNQPAGGSIFNAGTLSIAYCDFSNNFATGGLNFTGAGADVAGAVFNAGTLTVTETTMDNGYAHGGEGRWGAYGALGGEDGSDGGSAAGGIFSTGTLSVHHLAITNSTAWGGLGGAGGNAAIQPFFSPGGDGGAGGDAAAGIISTGPLVTGSSAQVSGGSATIGTGGTPGTGNPIGLTGQNGTASLTNIVSTGSIAAESHNGSSGNDVILGILAGQTASGLNGHDYITGVGTSTLYGGAGNDTLISEMGSHVYGGIGNDLIVNSFLFFGIWDGGVGVDTLDLHLSFSTNSIINLSLPSFTLEGGVFSGFENVIGTFSGDQITGSNGANILAGAGGDDTILAGLGNDTIRISGNGEGRDDIDGGGDLDTLDLSGMTQFAWVNLVYAGDEVQTQDGSAWRRVANMTGVENVIGTNFADRFYGDDNINIFQGGGGADIIYGRGGQDTLTGGAGSDQLYGEAGDDQLFADEGNDNLNGGSENDTFYFSTTPGNGLDYADGGAGTGDTVECVAFSEMAWIDLATAGYELYTKNAGAWLALANLVGIENANGSIFNDEFYGDAGSNRFDGSLGNDKLDGRGGVDTILGGDGNDTITGGDQGDFLDGGNDNDTFIFASNLVGIDNVEGGAGSDTADCSAFTTKAWVDLQYTGAEVFTLVLGGWVPIANLNSVENVIGSAVSDDLYGDALANVLSGGGGADVLAGRRGADMLTGGSGSDTFKFSPGDTRLTQATLDTITDFGKGAVGVGDRIDYSSALSVGGTTAAATASQASVNAVTGLATFASGSAATLEDAVSDVLASFSAATDSQGEFAFFRVNGVGPVYLLISDGQAGNTTNDVLIQLSSISSIGSINITGGDLTVLT